ncbi:hypothetical protein EZV73_22880 [Acidaminobacter sp. JC074]|uniref:DUF192 domain-containing protein n=1 Tax=Acidaminobacter sp. JC074 TaxID=2530199 RepID=UPI001F0EFB56|nr:DUF192 domain-containing protein [Acidaminobacter sp. JC074]MCH4890443.1 hypothetical protein [Acidaminobacter sp. JC074]
MDLYKNQVLLVKDIHIADTFIKRLRGYMFHEKPHYEGIVLSPCNSIHTFFMKFDIDVLFLDESMTVIDKYIGLEKNKVIKPIKDAVYTVEAQKNVFDLVEVGDRLKIC